MNSQEDLIKVLETIPWYQELDPKHFDKLMGISSLVEVEAGQELFHEGDKEDYLYIVVQGRVAIDMMVPGRGKMRIYTAEPMDVVGWRTWLWRWPPTSVWPAKLTMPRRRIRWTPGAAAGAG